MQKNPLPVFYHQLLSKKEVPTNILRKLEKSVLKTEKKKLDVIFLQRCLDLSVCPQFAKFKHANRILYDNGNTHEDVLKKTLIETKRELETLNQLHTNVKESVCLMLDDEEREKLEYLMRNEVEKQMKKVKATHDCKLVKLWLRQRSESPDCIVNLSKRTLTVEEKNVLYRGLNHHILPIKVNGDQLRVNIERLYLKARKRENDNSETRGTMLTSFIRDEIKFMTRRFLQEAKRVCSSKVNQSFNKQLKGLSNDENLAVVKFDKGNGICLMNKEDYLQKLDIIVNDETKFTRVERGKRKNAKHPLLKRQEDIEDNIKKHLKPYVPEDLRKQLMKKLIPRGTNAGKLYGTCKVHKPSYPLRPIVSMVNTPVYNLAKYLDKLIKPMIPQRYSINSNVEFIKQMDEFEHQDGDYCISFDVVSLFTNIPLTETIEIVARCYCAETSSNKPSIPEESFVRLLQCATGGTFSHRQRLYKQTDGVSMGNPLAPTLANFFMGTMEKSLMDPTPATGDSTTVPAMYVRYVDDIFCIFRKDDDFKPFLMKLNSYHPNLKFTYEMGGESLPFLDMKVTLEPTTFTTEVFRKATDTNVVMNNDSMAPTKWKTALAKWFIHRAERLCSNKMLFEKEVSHLKDIFRKNGYPDCFFEKVLHEHLAKERDKDEETTDREQGNDDQTRTKKNEQDLASPIATLKIPYIGKPSIQYARKLKTTLSGVITERLRVVYTTTKVKDHFQLKDALEKPLLSNVVYSFKCLGDPGIQYIGYTNRSLKERASEHLRGGTRISDHIAQCKACNSTKVTHEHFTVLKKCRSKWDTAVYEAIYIKRFNPVLNKQLVKPGYTHHLQIFN